MKTEDVMQVLRAQERGVLSPGEARGILEDGGAFDPPSFEARLSTGEMVIPESVKPVPPPAPGPVEPLTIPVRLEILNAEEFEAFVTKNAEAIRRALESIPAAGRA
jgi:hypothetical protein